MDFNFGANLLLRFSRHVIENRIQVIDGADKREDDNKGETKSAYKNIGHCLSPIRMITRRILRRLRSSFGFIIEITGGKFFSMFIETPPTSKVLISSNDTPVTSARLTSWISIAHSIFSNRTMNLDSSIEHFAQTKQTNGSATAFVLRKQPPQEASIQSVFQRKTWILEYSLVRPHHGQV